MEPGRLRNAAHLIPHVLFEVLIRGHIQTHTAIFEPFGLDLILRAWHCRDHDIAECEAFLQGERTRVHNMPGMVLPRALSVLRARPLCVFLAVGIRTEARQS